MIFRFLVFFTFCYISIKTNFFVVKQNLSGKNKTIITFKQDMISNLFYRKKSILLAKRYEQFYIHLPAI